MLTFEVHYGGRFEFEPLLSYVDGKICYFDEDETNFLSSVEWFNSLKRLGLPYDQEIYYKLPICTFEDRLRICNNDGSVVTMVEHCLLLDIVVTSEVGKSSENRKDDSSDETYVMEGESSDSDFDFFLDSASISDAM
ncbi:hypothetical protein M9H77_02722 [Catharanthus roseus]|uniref:Uncharacterized protein n=1 Tax=Catharanthus roseus TaxID=4058 RepID=A0ACC0C9M1_CATRO|nr:hypothetical protein M9H77_02722 [Catharanthus roseus]